MKTYMCYGCKIPCKLLCDNEYAPCFCQYTSKVCKWEIERKQLITNKNKLNKQYKRTVNIVYELI